MHRSGTSSILLGLQECAVGGGGEASRAPEMMPTDVAIDEVSVFLVRQPVLGGLNPSDEPNDEFVAEFEDAVFDEQTAGAPGWQPV